MKSRDTVDKHLMRAADATYGSYERLLVKFSADFVRIACKPQTQKPPPVRVHLSILWFLSDAALPRMLEGAIA